mmetsp:Transcript_8834/g.13182  ORF Transcript_8834/g.13182 Transcript_8834/m.13182 type:complete len:172 (-) Transcript_8834:189-704(-)
MSKAEGKTVNKSRKIVISTDLSEHSSEKLLDWSFKNILTKQDEVTILHVFEWTDIMDIPMDDEVMGLGSGNMTELNRQEKKRVREIVTKALEALLGICQSKGYKAKAVLLEGYPKVKICEYVNKHLPSFLVVSSRGLGAVNRFFLGSTSDYLVHNAECSVLVARDENKKKK